MSRTFEEGRLRFEFGESWQVEKYDDHRDYREKICRLEGTRAVDFVGILDGKALFLIEVKDLQGFRIESKKRVEQGELASEVALKTRDTLAGVIGAFRCSHEPEVWESYARSLAQRRRQLFVVLWLEEDRPQGRALSQRRTVTRGTLTQKLKRQLRWLTTKVTIVDRGCSQLPDLEVSYLRSKSPEEHGMD